MTSNVEFVTKTFHDCGGTFSLIGEDVPTSGYLVGGAGTEHVIGSDQFTPDSVQAFINQNRAQLFSKGFYLGTWIEDGRVYLDVSEHHDSYENAYALGQSRSEKAIWDIARKTSVHIYP